MFRKSPDLWLAGAVSALAIILTITGVSGPALIVFGLLLVFFIPGYTLVKVLNVFSPARAESWLLSIGLSLLLTLVGGIVLNLFEGGLMPRTWAVWLGGLTLIFAGIVLSRPSYQPVRKFKLPKVNPVQTGLVGLAVVLAVSAFMVARAGAAESTSSFTQLWLLPQASSQTTVNLGISNQENTTVKYRLQLEAGGTVVEEWPSLELAAGQEWKTTVNLPTGTAGVEANLYRLDQPGTVYRQVFFAASSAQTTTAAAKP